MIEFNEAAMEKSIKARPGECPYCGKEKLEISEDSDSSFFSSEKTKVVLDMQAFYSCCACGGEFTVSYTIDDVTIDKAPPEEYFIKFQKPFSMIRPYKTQEGKEVTIYSLTGVGKFKMIGVIQEGDYMRACLWNPETGEAYSSDIDKPSWEQERTPLERMLNKDNLVNTPE